MMVYWGMLALPSFFALVGRGASSHEERRAAQIGRAALFLIFTILIGLRFETGGDWVTIK